MGNFKWAVGVVFGEEGGIANNPNDRGGLTNMGITAGTLAAIGYHKRDPRQLTRAEAEEIYREHYWNPVRGDDLPDPLALITFDLVVNSGVGRARMLQEVLNSYGGGLVIDGRIGPRTVAVAVKVWGDYGLIMAGDFIAARRRFYQEIIAKNPSQEVFRRGWYNRLLHIAKAINKGIRYEY